MKVEFDESFEKSIKKLKDPKIKAILLHSTGARAPLHGLCFYTSSRFLND